MAIRWRKRWLIRAGAIGIVLLAGALAIALFSPRLTRYVESDAFRAELEKQTAKGLHFSAGKYAPIRRTGFLTASSDGFRAQNGRKALTSMDARVRRGVTSLGEADPTPTHLCRDNVPHWTIAAEFD